MLFLNTLKTMTKLLSHRMATSPLPVFICVEKRVNLLPQTLS